MPRETPNRPMMAAAPHCDTRNRYVLVGDVWWVVREIPYPASDRRTGTSLIFACDAQVSRIRHFPEAWFDLSVAALWILFADQY